MNGEKEAAMAKIEEQVSDVTGELHTLRVVEIPTQGQGTFRMPVGSEFIGTGVNARKNLTVAVLESSSTRLATYNYRIVKRGEKADLSAMKLVGSRQMDYEFITLFVSKTPHLDPNDEVAAGF